MKLVLKKNALQVLTASEANSVGGGVETDGCPTIGGCPTDGDCTAGIVCPSSDDCTNYICDTSQFDCSHETAC